MKINLLQRQLDISGDQEGPKLKNSFKNEKKPIIQNVFNST